MKRLALALLLCAATAAQAQFHRDAQYERVLIPVFFFGGGAHGAQWWTDVDLMNTGNTFDLATPLLENDPACPALCGCNATATVSEGEAESVCPIFENIAGLILYVPRNVDRSQVHIAARGRDLSRSAERFGSQIPVVWERDLHDNPMVLLDIPTSSLYRTTLRLYDVYQWSTDFDLNIYDMNDLRRGDRTPLVTSRVRAQWDGAASSGPYPPRPAFAIIGDLVATYPQLKSATSVAIEMTGSDLTISPPQPGQRFYALASITNNATQELTIVSPR